MDFLGPPSRPQLIPSRTWPLSPAHLSLLSLPHTKVLIALCLLKQFSMDPTCSQPTQGLPWLTVEMELDFVPSPLSES